jgi:IS30 family transposase
VGSPKETSGIPRAYFKHHYTQQEIANYLGVHYSTISRRVHAIDSCRRRNTMRDCGTLSPMLLAGLEMADGLRVFA